MPIETKLYRVLIASPSDVAKERTIVRKVIDRWNSNNALNSKIALLAVGWETHATPDLDKDGGQAVINRQIVDNCDLLIGIFWTRLGTPTSEAPSGTVEEINRAASQNKRCIVYFASKKRGKPATFDEEQYENLQQYRQELQKSGLTSIYDNLASFEQQVYDHVVKAMQAIINEDIERRAAENRARLTEQAIGLKLAPIQASNPSSINLTTLADAQITVKHLLESRFGLQDMEDAREKEIAIIKDALSSPDLAVLFNRPRNNTENISAIVQVIETVSTPSLFAISSIGKYGDDTSPDWVDLVGEWIESLCTPKIESSYTVWVRNIKMYSSLLTFYALGISSLRSGKIHFLHELIERQIYLRSSNREINLVEAIHPFRVFTEDVDKYIEPGFTENYTPASDHLSKIIKDKLYFNEELEKYLEWFDLFEFLVCLKSFQLKGYGHYGSFSYRIDTRRFILKAIQEAILKRGKLGMSISNLFNGTQELEEVVQNYDNKVRQTNWDYGRNPPEQISKLIMLTKAKQKIIPYRDFINLYIQ